MTIKTRSQLKAALTDSRFLLNSKPGDQLLRDLIDSADVSNLYDVTRYGALLDGTTDDTQAIVDAAADMRSAGRGTLFFPPGGKARVKWHAHAGLSGNNLRRVLNFAESGHFRVAGNGTEILFDADDRSDYGSFIHADSMGQSASLEVSGFTYKYLKPPFVTGVVTAIVAGDYIELVLDNHPTWSDVQRAYRFEDKIIDELPVLPRTGGTWDAGNTITQVSGTTYRIAIDAGQPISATLTNLVVGDEMLIEHHIFSAHFIRSQDGGHVFAHHNVIQNCAGSPFRLLGGEHANVSDNWELADPTLRCRRSHSSDGCHISGFRSVIVKDNYFEFTGDDNINVTTKVTKVTSRDSDTEVTCSRSFPAIAPLPGHLVQFFDATRETTHEAHIVSVDAISSSAFTLTVTGTLPAGVDNTWEMAFLVEDAHIAGNTLSYGRGRCIYTSARRLAILDNLCIQSSGPGILVDSQSIVHTAVKSLAIKGNIIESCNLSPHGTPPLAALAVHALQDDGASLIPGTVHENIDISGNRISRTNNGGIFVLAGQRVDIRDNKLVSIDQRRFGIFGFTGGRPIMVRYCDDVLIEGNSLSGNAAMTFEQQDSTNIEVGVNPGMTPSSGTNPVTFISPNGYFNDVNALGQIASSPASAAAVLSAFGVSGQIARVQIGESGGTAWYLGKKAGEGTLRLGGSATFASNLFAWTGAGAFGVNVEDPDYKLHVVGAIGFAPGTPITPVSSGDVVFEFTSNTEVNLKGKGDDGIVRKATLTLSETGGTFIISSVGDAAAALAILDSDAGQAREVSSRTGGLKRWAQRVNSAAESGSNVGSDYELKAYDDAGVFLGNAFTVNRATQVMTIIKDLRLDAALEFAPSSSETPTNNGDVVFEFTNDTTLTIRAKGSDGTVRSGTVTLA